MDVPAGRGGAGLNIFLPNYNLGKTLGIGSFGKVKIAKHVLTGHMVAIKILNRCKIKNMEMEEKVKLELEVLKLLSHPRIIKLLEVIETPTDICVVMEYACRELFDYVIEKGRLEEDEARNIFQQIISGLEYCHNKMVVHRDLKSENILLDFNCDVKITGFGWSNIMHAGYFHKTSCGSTNYAAPEGGIFTLPCYLSPGARDLISKMLDVEPMKRITVSEIQQHPWLQLQLQPNTIDTM